MTLGITRRVRFCCALLLACGALLMASGPIAAQDISAALQRFSADSFSDTETAIGEIAVSGHPLAAAIIQAIPDGNLLFDEPTKQVFLREASGRVLDVASGDLATAVPAGLKPVRINNRLRRAVEAAIGGLTLMSPDPARRLEAAQAVFRSKDESLLPVLEQAIEKESNGRIRLVLISARAAIVLAQPAASEPDKLFAVAVLRERGDQDALALLSNLPADAPASVKTSAEAAVGAITAHLALMRGAQNAWYGLSLGSVLLLAAIGLAITFGVMGVINMAHGEMVMLGAYTTFVVQDLIRAHDPSLFDYSLAIAIPLAFLVAGSVGVVIERTVIRFLYGRTLETLLATWGISLILQQAVRTAFGPTNREVGAPSWMSGSVDFAGLAITYNRLWIIVFALMVFGLLLALLRYSRFGLEMRAVTQNRRMAASMGIRTHWVDAMTFGLGSGIAGIAGVALSQIDNVSPNLGQSYIIDSFLVVVFGGVGNLWGTLVGALSIGIANKFLEPYAGAVLGKIILLVAIILFIQKRPRGLFALKGRAVEA